MIARYIAQQVDALAFVPNVVASLREIGHVE